MKRVVFILLMLWAAGGAARAELQFAGYIEAADGARFVLTDTATGSVSEWLEVGGSFAGHMVTGFDARSGTLSVEKAGAISQLRLKTAQIAAASAGEAAGSPSGVGELPAGVADSPLARFIRTELKPAQAKLNELTEALRKLVTERGKLESPPADAMAAANRNGLRIDDLDVKAAYARVLAQQETMQALSKRFRDQLRDYAAAGAVGPLSVRALLP